MKRKPPLFTIPESEVEIEAIRAQGAGGQNINKVSNAVHLRFDVARSSLPAGVKTRLLTFGDSRLTAEGVLVIKAQRHRSLERNRADAIARLHEIVARVALPPTPRKPTRPTLASRRRRGEDKARRGQVKALRGRVVDER
jgi:ribosome-associated protein